MSGTIQARRITKVELIQNNEVALVYFEGKQKPIAIMSHGQDMEDLYQNLTVGFWDANKKRIYY